MACPLCIMAPPHRPAHVTSGGNDIGALAMFNQLVTFSYRFGRLSKRCILIAGTKSLWDLSTWSNAVLASCQIVNQSSPNLFASASASSFDSA